MQHIRLTAMLLMLFAAGASAQTLDVLKVDYVKTSTDAEGRVTKVVEEGTYQIAPDGVYRVDRRDAITGARTVTIEDSRISQRTTMDLARQEAHVSSTATMPRGAPSAWKPVDSQQVDLGTKQAGMLTLKGYRFTTMLAGPRGQIVHHNEVWSYMPANPSISPVILELRFDTPTGIEEQKVVAVERLKVSKDIFSVPRTFKVRK